MLWSFYYIEQWVRVGSRVPFRL